MYICIRISKLIIHIDSHANFKHYLFDFDIFLDTVCFICALSLSLPLQVCVSAVCLPYLPNFSRANNSKKKIYTNFCAHVKFALIRRNILFFAVDHHHHQNDVPFQSEMADHHHLVWGPVIHARISYLVVLSPIFFIHIICLRPIT